MYSWWQLCGRGGGGGGGSGRAGRGKDHLWLLLDDLPPPEPPMPSRNLSEAYGRGASKYDEAVLIEWKEHGLHAADAAKKKKWRIAREEFATCVSLRPDWVKGHACLTRAKAMEKARRRKRWLRWRWRRGMRRTGAARIVISTAARTRGRVPTARWMGLLQGGRSRRLRGPDCAWQVGGTH